MKINYHIENEAVLPENRVLIESKLQKLKIFVKTSPLIIDLYITDQAGGEKGGIDQSVRLSAEFGAEKFFVEKVDSEVMRAFAHCYKKMEYKLERYHKKLVDNAQK